MKTRLLLFFMSIASFAVISCGGDDSPEIDPLIGEWEVDEFELTDVPTEFSNVAGPRSNLRGENRYRIKFNQDFTYERELRFSGSDFDEDGEWERNEDALELDPDDDTPLSTDFSIIEINGENLVLDAGAEFILMPNSVKVDTVTTQESLDALFDEYGVLNFITVIYRMEKI